MSTNSDKCCCDDCYFDLCSRYELKDRQRRELCLNTGLLTHPLNHKFKQKSDFIHILGKLSLFCFAAVQQNTCQSNSVGGTLKSLSFNLLLWKFMCFFPQTAVAAVRDAKLVNCCASEDYSSYPIARSLTVSFTNWTLIF